MNVGSSEIALTSITGEAAELAYVERASEWIPSRKYIGIYYIQG